MEFEQELQLSRQELKADRLAFSKKTKSRADVTAFLIDQLVGLAENRENIANTDLTSFLDAIIWRLENSADQENEFENQWDLIFDIFQGGFYYE